jgi:hypothetical protein
MKISDYRLIKICYDQSLKEFESNFLKLTKKEFEFLKKITDENINISIHKRNNIVDWIWITNEDFGSILNILEKYEIRHKITDHTDTYNHNPEKLTVLRAELDKWMQSFLDIDLILDHIGEVGIDSITKIERKYLQENFNKV